MHLGQDEEEMAKARTWHAGGEEKEAKSKHSLRTETKSLETKPKKDRSINGLKLAIPWVILKYMQLSRAASTKEKKLFKQKETG